MQNISLALQSLVEKYPKVESKVFRGGAIVGEYEHQFFKRLYDVDESMLRCEPEDQQHVAGVSGRALPVDPRLRLLDQDEGGHPRRHGRSND